MSLVPAMLTFTVEAMLAIWALGVILLAAGVAETGSPTLAILWAIPATVMLAKGIAASRLENRKTP